MKHSFEHAEITDRSIDTLSEKLLEAVTKLSLSNMELKKMQKDRSMMMANISHDLRAPITAIRSAIDYLTSGQTLSEEEKTETLQLIHRRTKTLEDLIEDMYFLFCMEDTAHPISLQAIPAAPFFEEYFYDTIIDSRYDTHDMQLDISPNLDACIRIDPPKMVRVLDNLFTNAAKYSGPDTRILLQVRLDDTKSRLLISVSDNGIGISPDALGQIFNRTYTVSTARTPGGECGSGLGLSIAKAIVERFHGTISCQSALEEGTTFSISLPVHT